MRATHCRTPPPVIAALDAAIFRPSSIARPLGRGNPLYTYQNAFLQLWYVKTKKTWQLLKITTFVLKITLNS